MPFVAGDFSSDPAYQSYRAGERASYGQPPPPSTPTKLDVPLESVVQLRRELETIRARVNKFLVTRGMELDTQPLGSDPLSSDVRTEFNDNADTARSVASDYIARLQAVIESLDQTIKTYHLIEDANADAFKLKG